MPYRQTERVRRRLSARRDAILMAAHDIAAESGLQGVQILPVSQRAGIAAGTIYRYFPGKTDLVAALIRQIAKADLDAMQAAASAAPGPLSALSAGIVAFASRALERPRLIWAALAEPVDPELGPVQTEFRQQLAAFIDRQLRAAVERKSLPPQDGVMTAAAIFGALVEGLLGPLIYGGLTSPQSQREAAQTLTLFALRGAGVMDARARGLVVQTTSTDARAS